MLRIAFTGLLIIHGLIHLIGFVNEWKLAATQFSGKTFFPLSGAGAKTAGLLWLLSTLLFLATAILFFREKANWWMPALAAVALSQALVIVYWADARFGTIANLIVLVVALPAWGKWRFDEKCRQEIAEFSAKARPAAGIVGADQLAACPPVVQKWLVRAGVVGKPRTRTLRLRQTGAMRTQPDGDWMPFEAGQLFTTDPPGFYWKTDVGSGALLRMNGRDKYADGRGSMFIQWQGLFTVADASGPATDQGSLLRYLGELSWFPSAALSDYIHWEEADSLSARATMRWAGVEATGVFHFTAEGDPLRFEAERYYDRGGTATLENWVVRHTAWRTVDGLRIPCAGEVSWLLDSGDFTWFRFELTELAYDEGGDHLR